MKIFLAGATGAIGKRLLPMLVAAGHQVTGTTRTAGKAEAIRSAGARAEVLDALNKRQVMEAVHRVEPDVIIHELTAIPASFNLKRFRRGVRVDEHASYRRNRLLVSRSARNGMSPLHRAELYRVAICANRIAGEEGRGSADKFPASRRCERLCRPFSMSSRRSWASPRWQGLSCAMEPSTGRARRWGEVARCLKK